MLRCAHGIWIALAVAASVQAAQHRVPLNCSTIQAAVDAGRSGLSHS